MEPRLETELVLTTESREQLICRPAIMGPPTRPAEESPAPSHPIPTTAIKAICRWTEQDDLTLIAVLRAEQQLNPTPTGGFKGSAWPAAAAALAGSEERTGSKTKDPIGCRSRYSSLKRSYLELKDLRGLAEARWDEEVQRVMLPEEVWANLLGNASDKGKNLSRWRHKRFPLYAQVGALIEGGSAAESRQPRQALAQAQAHVVPGPSISEKERVQYKQEERPGPWSPEMLAEENQDQDSNEEEEEEEEEHPGPNLFSAPHAAKRRRIATHHHHDDDLLLKHLKEIGDHLKTRPSPRIDAIRLLQKDRQLALPEMLKAIDCLGSLELAETYLALDSSKLRTTWIRSKIGNL
ncbi:hypothetical protein PCASD_25994 [Puccinia coronata f. sp. avenae]|uniref:Myb/SANT-like domain-containing protein n=1 Tax=Puccinia coronata f. sp. avenae TaxID=200324 RepID=A0A2N5TI54_9BASI|nr:hypothetical protein PCASD_25994 [Puccinia coronata f. sp. avenae]